MSPKTPPTTIVKRLSFRNRLAFSISILSFFFLFPGVYLSMLNIANTGSVNANLPHVESNILGIPSVKGTQKEHMPLHIVNTDRSILKTVYNLYTRKYYFVASMIFLFSVIIPVTKELLLCYISICKDQKTRSNLFSIIKAIGKWSMCDVFTVAIFLSYLSTGASQTENVKNITVMGYNVNVDILAGMQAHLEMGFWFFLTYCLLSLIAVQLYESY